MAAETTELEAESNNNSNKENSVSLSLSDEKDNNTDITISLKPSDVINNKNKLEVSVNRTKFMKTAPSLMRLLSIGKSTDSDKNESNQQLNTAHIEQEPDFFKKSSVVNELMAEYEKNAIVTNTQKDNTMDMEILANEAAKEFQILAIQNDELFKEKEQFKQRYDDLYNEMEELQKQLKDIELYKYENQNLLTENAKYQSQSVIFEQEKNIMQETINNLNQEINSLTAENNNENNAPDIYSNDNNIDLSIQQTQLKSINNNNNNDNQRLMVQIANITKEKNELEHILEEYKIKSDKNKSEMNQLNMQLKETQNEVERLSNDLTEQQNKYIKLQQTKQQQTDKYERQLSIHSDNIVNEYKAKQIELLGTVQNQKKIISDLRRENDAFSKKDTSKKKSTIHQRLRTQQNLFGQGQTDSMQYDDDPFGGNEENEIHDSFMNYNESFEEMNNENENDNEMQQVDENEEDRYIVENHNKIVDGYKTKQIELLETIENQKNMINELEMEKRERDNKFEVQNNEESMENTSKCGCMVSFFDRFKNNNNSNKNGSHLTVKNDYVLMK